MLQAICAEGTGQGKGKGRVLI